jgi:hypothetical protein
MENKVILIIFIIIALLSFIFVFQGSDDRILKSPADPCDKDEDSYISEDCGGDDCYDSEVAYYVEGTTECSESNPATTLQSYNDPDLDGPNIADHSWVQDDNGIWHLFFQWNCRDGSTHPYCLNTDIAHFTSTDLTNITHEGTALVRNQSAYYDSIWAPHVIKHDGLYYMFFTGVERPGNPWTQRIGLATSTNLIDWEMYPVNNCPGAIGEGCVYDCNETYTGWNESSQFKKQCRDPMVFWDQGNERWLMFTTTVPNLGSTNIVDWSQMISVSSSTDLINWDGMGYISRTGWNYVSGYTDPEESGGASENPFLTEFNGTYYLTFTDHWDDPDLYNAIQYVRSDTLEFDETGSLNWEYMGSIQDGGTNAAEIININNDTWIFSESISTYDNPEGTWRNLLLKRINWNSDKTFSFSNLTNLNCRSPSENINPGAVDIPANDIDENCDGTEAQNLHPRLLFTEDEIPALKAKLNDGGYDQEAFDFIINSANSIIQYSSPSSIRGGSGGIHNIPKLALAYQLSDNSNPNKDTYGQKCREAILYMVSSSDSSGEVYDASERLYSLSLGFDMCFDVADPTDRQSVITEIEEYLTKATQPWPNGGWYEWKEPPFTFNKMIMASSTVGMGSIVLRGESANEQLLNNALEYSNYVLQNNFDHSFGEDGSHGEGVTYGMWSARFLIPYIESRLRYDGKDYSKYPNIKYMDRWLSYSLRPNPYSFINNLNDARQTALPLATHNTYIEWAQTRYDSNLARWIAEKKRSQYGTNSDRVSAALWSKDLSIPNPDTILDDSHIFEHRGLYYYRTGWPDPTETETDDSVFSFYAGKFWGGHAQEDQGQFTLFSKGENFISDSGPNNPPQYPNKETENHNLILIDGNGQHNAGVIIGTDGNITSYSFNSFADFIHGDTKSAYDTHSEFNIGFTYGLHGSNPVLNSDRYVTTIKKSEVGEYFVILDDINKDNNLHDYSLVLHTPFGNIFDVSSNPMDITGTNKGNILDIYFVNPDPSQFSFTQVQTSGEDGPIKDIYMEINAVNPYYTYILYPRLSTDPSPTYTPLTVTGEGFGLSLEFGNTEDTLLFANGTNITSNDITTDAKTSVIRSLTEFTLGEGTYLENKIPLVEIVGGEGSVISSEDGITISDNTLGYRIYAPGIDQVRYKDEYYDCSAESTGICTKASIWSDYIYINGGSGTPIIFAPTDTSVIFKEGMNTFSIPVLLTNYSVESVFASDLDKIDLIYAYSETDGWLIYSRDPRIQTTLTELDLKKGYFVKANTDFILDLSGATTSQTFYRNPRRGWNLIGLDGISPDQIINFLSLVNYTDVWEYNETTSSLEQLDPLTDTFLPSKGYWVYVEDSSSLYSPNKKYKNFFDYIKRFF